MSVTRSMIRPLSPAATLAFSLTHSLLFPGVILIYCVSLSHLDKLKLFSVGTPFPNLFFPDYLLVPMSVFIWIYHRNCDNAFPNLISWKKALGIWENLNCTVLKEEPTCRD